MDDLLFGAKHRVMRSTGGTGPRGSLQLYLRVTELRRKVKGVVA